MRSAPTLVLCYHRVASGVSDPYRLCVSPDHFAAHLRRVQRKAEIVPIDEMLRPSRRARVVITFDDGYADNLFNAVEVADALDVPITVYVTSGMMGSPKGFWWDRLARLVSCVNGPRQAVVSLRGERVTFSFGGPGAKDKDLASVHHRLRELPVAEIEAALDALAAVLGCESSAPPDALPLSPEELCKLAAHRAVTIGAHTVEHQWLAGQEDARQLQTMSQSKAALERMLERPVLHFAYPFGGSDAVDDASYAAAATAGFATAVTTLPGSFTFGSDPYRVPRRLVMDWTERRFSLQMLRWGLIRS